MKLEHLRFIILFIVLKSLILIAPDISYQVSVLSYQVSVLLMGGTLYIRDNVPLTPVSLILIPKADRLLDQGYEQYQISQYQAAIQSWETALKIYREIGAHNGELDALRDLGSAYNNLGQYQKAIKFYQQSLTLAHKIGDRNEEGYFLHNLGHAYFSLGQYQKAIDFYQQSLTIYREISADEAELDALRNLGSAYNNLGQYQKAIKFYQQSLTLPHKISDDGGEIDALRGLVSAYNNLGQYQKAIELLQQSLTLARKMRERYGEVDALNNLAEAYRNLGQYQKGIELLQQSLTLARKMGDRYREVDALNNLGSAYNNLGQYQKAIELFQQSLTLVRDSTFYHRHGYISPVEVDALRGLGSAYNNLGQYQKAIEFYQQSLTFARSSRNPNREGEGDALRGLGSAYNNLGQYQKAIEFYQQSLSLAREIGNPNGEGDALNNLGYAYNKLGQYQKAMEFYQQSLTLTHKIGDRNGEGLALNNLGYAYNNLGQYQKAIKFYQQSLTLDHKIGDRNGEGDALNNLGYAYNNLGQYQKAIEFYQQSLTLAREIGNRNGEGLALNNLGLALFKLSNFPESEKHLFSSLEVWESLRQGIQDDLNKVSLFETQRNSYNSLQKVLIAQNKTDQALEVSERGRGRALAELLAQRLTPNSKQFSPVISLAQLQKIAQQQNATIVEYSLIKDEFSLGGKKQVKESELYIWVIKPTGEVEFRRADLKLLWQQQNTSLGDLIFASRCFNNDACKSDFIVASANSNLTRSTLRDSSLFNAQSNLREKAIQNTSVNSPQYPELQQLYQLLIKPIEDLLPNHSDKQVIVIPTDSLFYRFFAPWLPKLQPNLSPNNPDERVIFIPTDSLFYLPFAALQDEQGKFLIEKHTILTSPSIALLETTHKQRKNLSSSAKDLVIVGNPKMPKVPPIPGEEPKLLASLPNAEKEAIKIAKVLKTSALIGANATESTVVQRMKNARIIHFATHGIFDNLEALNSGVALTPGDSQDGLLTAYEIFDLKLNAELVVLSACETGLGQLTGDGVIGLSRSFLSAGVPSLVVSLWSVDDQRTSQLMTQFYQNLQRTPDKAQALRQAMLTIKNKNPDPYYWAAFTLIGEAQ